VEHVIGPAVDQRDPPALEAPEEAVEDGDRRREEPPFGDLDELLRKYLCSSLGVDGLLPASPWGGRLFRRGPGGGGRKCPPWREGRWGRLRHWMFPQCGHCQYVWPGIFSIRLPQSLQNRDSGVPEGGAAADGA